MDDNSILNQLYKKIEKPKNLTKEYVINVYTDRYRINLWEDHKIVASYFVIVNEDGLKIK